MTSEHFSKTEYDEFDKEPDEYVDKFTNRLIDHTSLENQHYELKTYLFNIFQKDEPNNNEKLGPNNLSINIFDTIRAMMSNNGGVIAVGIKEDVLKEKKVKQENKTSMYKDLKTEIEKIYKNKIETPTYTASSFDDKFEKYKIHATQIINHLFSTYTNYNKINCEKYFKVEPITLKKTQIHLVFIFVHPSFKEEKKYIGITDFSIYNHYPPNKQKNKYLQRDNGFNKAVNAETIAEEEQKMKDEEPASIKAVKKAIFDGLESQSEAQRKERNAETEKIINANTQQNTPLSDSLFQDLLERLELMYADIQKQEDNDDKETLNLARKIDAKLDEYLADKLQKGDQLLHETDNYPWNEELDTFKNLRAQIINHIRFLSKNPDEEDTRKIAKLKKKVKQIEDTIKFIQSKITPKTEDLEPPPPPPTITVPPSPPDPEPQPVPTPTPPPADRGSTSNGFNPKYLVIIVGIFVVGLLAVIALTSSNDTSVPIDPPIVCADGFRDVNGRCEQIPPEPPVCADGFREVNGVCVQIPQELDPPREDPPIVCAEGFREVNGVCVQIPQEPDPPAPDPPAPDPEPATPITLEQNKRFILRGTSSNGNSQLPCNTYVNTAAEGNYEPTGMTDAQDDKTIFFGQMHGAACAKSTIVFDLNSVLDKLDDNNIDSIELSFVSLNTGTGGAADNYGCGDLRLPLRSGSNQYKCHDPDSLGAELKYHLSENSNCAASTKELFESQEGWTDVTSWNYESPDATRESSADISQIKDDIDSSSNRYLCISFTDELNTSGDNALQENYRLHALGNIEIKFNFVLQ